MGRAGAPCGAAVRGEVCSCSSPGDRAVGKGAEPAGSGLACGEAAASVWCVVRVLWQKGEVLPVGALAGLAACRAKACCG